MQMDKFHTEMTINLWNAFKQSYLGIIEMQAKLDTSRLTLGGEYKIKWACAWNRIQDIGHKCIVLATAPGFAIVSIFPDYQGNVYRNEDLTPVI